MSEPWGNETHSKAEALTFNVNRLLSNAVIQCSRGDNRVLDYFEVGVLGYGAEVQFALHGADIDRPLLPISAVADNPRRVDEIMGTEPDGAGGNVQVPMLFPVW